MLQTEGAAPIAVAFPTQFHRELTACSSKEYAIVGGLVFVPLSNPWADMKCVRLTHHRACKVNESCKYSVMFAPHPLNHDVQSQAMTSTHGVKRVLCRSPSIRRSQSVQLTGHKSKSAALKGALSIPMPYLTLPRIHQYFGQGLTEEGQQVIILSKVRCGCCFDIISFGCRHVAFIETRVPETSSWRCPPIS